MDVEEQQHFLEVIEGFVHYKAAMYRHLARKESGWEVARRAGRVPDDLYAKMEDNFVKLREAGWLLLVVVGCGWLWLVVVGCGWCGWC